MSLLCALGRHRPGGIPRWNDGFYFARCERCDCDLVRTAFTRWHVPRGYRVVWSDRPPAGRPDVAMIPEASAPPAPATPPTEISHQEPPLVSPPEPVAPFPSPHLFAEQDKAAQEPAATDDRSPPEAPMSSAASSNGRLPIQDVLEQLNAEDAGGPARETPPPPADGPSRRRSTWDFMDDDPFDDHSPSGAMHPRPSESAAPTGSPAPGDPHKGPASRARVGGLPELWRRVRSAVRNFSSGPAEPRPLLVIGLAFALAVAVAAVMALYWAGGSERPPAIPGGSGEGARGAEDAEATDPFAASAPEVPIGDVETSGQGDGGSSSGERAYVAASLLSCRAAPVLQARRVRNLGRGAEVRVLGYDGEWASLALRGGQCWARTRFLSPVPPL